jgi:2-methylcitrate dehydratase PrpD
LRTTYKVEELPEFPAAFPARVTVTMRSGEKHIAYIAHNLGTPGNPMRAEDIRRKFLSCAAPGIGDARAREISGLVESFAQAGAAEQLFEILHETEIR